MVTLDHVTLCHGPPPDTAHLLASNIYGTYCIPQDFKRREVPLLLRAGQVYEPATLEYMRRYMGPGDVISGGAFVGDFFPALHEALAPGAQIHSFEPFPDSFDAAAYTCALNNLERIRLHRCAVGAEDGVLPLAISRGARNKSLAAGMRLVDTQKKDPRLTTISVPVTTIDALVPETRPVSLLHLDVEGFELPALQGAARIIAAHQPLVILEGDKPRVLRGYLEALNALAPEAKYTHIGSIEHNSLFRPMAQG